MKILLLIPALGSLYGGPSKIVPALAAALARRGESVDLVTTDASGTERLPVPAGNWVRQDGYRLRYFRRLGRFEFKLSPSLLAWLWRHAADYDVVHITSLFNFPVLACSLACRWRGVPYIVAPQGMLEPWALGYKSGKKKAYLRLVEWPLVLRGARLIQALNGNEAANLEKLRLGPPVAVLPNGIEAEEALRENDSVDAAAFLDRFPAARDKTVILFLHRVDPKKGLDVLAPAFAAAHERFPQTHLVVAGPPTGCFQETARSYCEAAGVAGAVTFTGMLDGVLKRGALAAASVFVAPSYSEGFSMAVLEAMAAGLPCVISEACNFPEAGAAGAARLFPTGDVDRFAAALSELLERRAEARDMGRLARELVLSGYTWPSIAEGLEKQFGAILLSSH